MTSEEWETLESLSTGKKKTPEEKILYGNLLEKTEQEEEHPDFFDGACMCKTCKSYA